MASITQRKNKDGTISYKVLVSLGYDDLGNKIQKTTTFKPTSQAPTKARKEVEAFAVEFEKAVKNGTACLSGDKIRLKEFVKIWEDNYLEKNVLSGSISIRTKEDYVRLMETHIIPYIGNMKLSEIRATHIDNVVLQLLKAKKSANTIRNIFNTLHACLDYAFKKDYIPVNPCLKCDPLPTVEHDASIHTFNEDQATRFLYEALVKEYNINIGGRIRHYEKRSVSLQFRTFFTLAFYSGCRRGEIVALNWNDIDSKAKTIRIDQAVSRSSEGLYLKDPKTKAGKRTIKLPEVCFDLLNQWKLEQMQICMALGSAWDGYRGRDYDKNPVFIQDDGKRMDVSTPTSKFKKIINAYNETVSDEKKLPLIRLHDLRHTNASHMIASGIDLETAAKRLGHSKPSFTLDVYGHALEENDERASEVLGKMFAKAQ